MRLSIVLLSLLVLIAGVNSHALLKVPAPWNPSASKTANCGGGQPQNAAQATYCPGQTYTLQWTVQVSDGVGPVTFAINLASKSTSNFTTTLKTDSSPTAVNTYSVSVTMPNSECTLCTLQAFSSSNWYSCSTISISSAACGTGEVTEAPLTPVKVDNELTFCTMKNKKTVMVPAGTNIKDLDKATQSSFNANLNNPLVFENNDTNCRQLYYPFICDLAFPQANETSLTQQECDSFSSACSVTELHSSLYPCSSYPLEESSANTVSVISTLAVVVISMVVLLF